MKDGEHGGAEALPWHPFWCANLCRKAARNSPDDAHSRRWCGLVRDRPGTMLEGTGGTREAAKLVQNACESERSLGRAEQSSTLLADGTLPWRPAAIMRVVLALICCSLSGSSAFLLPQGPPQFHTLTPKGVNAAVATYATAAALTAQAAPLLDERIGHAANTPPLHSAVLLYFASCFAIGYGMRQLQSALLRKG